VLPANSYLRRNNPHDKRIDKLSSSIYFSNHCLHLPLEELVDTVGFNEPPRALVAASVYIAFCF
jgi:4-alpha-glucanotransferase